MSPLKGDNEYQYYLSNSETAFSGGSWINYTNGTAFTIGSGLTGQYYLFVKRVNDNLSNISIGTEVQEVNDVFYHRYGPYKFDNQGPIFTVTNPDSGWVKSKSVTISVADSHVGSLKSDNSYQYYLSNSATALSGGGWTNYTSGTAFTIGTNLTGQYYLFVKRVNDNLSNISTGGTGNTNTTVSSVTYHRYGPYKFDNQGPGFAVTGPDDVYTKTKNLTISISDAHASTLSNSNSYQYYLSNSATTLSDGTWTNYTNGTVFTVGSGKTGEYYLFVKRISGTSGKESTGITGNADTTVSSVVYHRYGPYKFDNTGPVFTVTQPDNTYTKTKNLTISVSDSHITTLKSDNSYQYYLSNSATSLSGGSWTNYTNGTAFTAGSGKTGEYYLFVKRVNDSLSNISTGGTGNTNTTVSSVVYHRFGPYKFDNQGPVVTATNPDSGWVKTKSVTISVADALSSLKSDNSYQYYLSTSATALSGEIGRASCRERV